MPVAGAELLVRVEQLEEWVRVVEPELRRLGVVVGPQAVQIPAAAALMVEPAAPAEPIAPVEPEVPRKNPLLFYQRAIGSLAQTAEMERRERFYAERGRRELLELAAQFLADMEPLVTQLVRAVEQATIPPAAQTVTNQTLLLYRALLDAKGQVERWRGASTGPPPLPSIPPQALTPERCVRSANNTLTLLLAEGVIEWEEAVNETLAAYQSANSASWASEVGQIEQLAGDLEDTLVDKAWNLHATIYRLARAATEGSGSLAHLEAMARTLVQGLGIAVIEPVGADYDAYAHRLVAERTGTGQPGGKVVAVVEPGYRKGNKELERPSVYVSK